jgi:hypothetical protein
MSEPISLAVVIERIDGMRDAQEQTNSLIREHIEEDRAQLGEIRVGLAGIQQTVHTEMARREGHASAIANLERGKVSTDEFAPVKMIAFGLVALLASAVVTAVVAWLFSARHA